MIEIWKPVKGYEGLYEVSNIGRVKSMERYVNSGIRNNNVVLMNKKGEAHHLAKLNEKQVRVIKHCFDIGMRNMDIIKYFPVTKGAISLIRRGKSWKHI